MHMIQTLARPEVVERQKNLKIVYTPIHGTGVKLIPAALRKFGFANIINVPEQDVVSGDFPTVVSPNPEETAAMKMAVEKFQSGGMTIAEVAYEVGFSDPAYFSKVFIWLNNYYEQ